WSYLNPDTEFLVYPALESPTPRLPQGDGREDEQARAGSGEEHAGLRDYRVTDPPRLIAWKASARHDTLLVRDAERRGDDALIFDFSALAGLDYEARIRRLTAWIVAAESTSHSYVLRIPGAVFGPGVGAAHRNECLRALALLPHA
ncbi:MAG: DUF58 domain-containing protein, partial [Rhodanobacteraceae bacterium]